MPFGLSGMTSRYPAALRRGGSFFVCEFRRGLTCMSISKSPNDIVGLSREAKMECSAGEGDGYG